MILPLRHHPVQLGSVNIARIALTQIRDPNQRHRHLKLVLHDLDEMLHALLAVIDGI